MPSRCIRRSVALGFTQSRRFQGDSDALSTPDEKEKGEKKQ